MTATSSISQLGAVVGAPPAAEKAGVGLRVVIAEDHPLVRDGIRQVLQATQGITVVGEAANGEEAVRVVADVHPDVVLMDISMPKLNVIEATRQIKAKHPETAVLILTTHDDEAFVSASAEAGAAALVMKTASGRELLGVIRKAQAGVR